MSRNTSGLRRGNITNVGRKPKPEVARRKQRTVYHTDAEHAAYTEWLKQLRQAPDKF